MREAMKDFERGLKNLDKAADHALPIARPGFHLVSKEIRRVLQEYIEPLLD